MEKTGYGVVEISSMRQLALLGERKTEPHIVREKPVLGNELWKDNAARRRRFL
ncbi:MAG: hypothetical protein K2X55_02060 [Burkholderiaceae bacterium]|nr:hypothetical protein [Burkholderiaceae bacterium]